MIINILIESKILYFNIDNNDIDIKINIFNYNVRFLIYKKELKVKNNLDALFG